MIEYDLHKKLSIDEFVDVCAGKMTLAQLYDDIENIIRRTPDKIVITIERNDYKLSYEVPPARRDKIYKQYYTTLYITRDDFQNG